MSSCGNCNTLTTAETGFPCVSCERIIYCSQECNTQHWDTDHKWECHETQICWGCDTLGATIECPDCEEAIYCSQECLRDSKHDHVRFDGCFSVDGSVDSVEQTDAPPSLKEDLEAIKREAKKGRKLRKKNKVKTAKAGRIRRLVRFLFRQGLRVTQAAGTAVSSVFGVDTIVDAITFVGVEVPLFSVSFVSVLRSSQSIYKIVTAMVAVRTVTDPATGDKHLLGPFEGGIDGVSARIDPYLDQLLSTKAGVKTLRTLGQFVQKIGDRLAGLTAGGFEFVIPVSFGAARMIIYEALYMVFIGGSNSIGSIIRSLYYKVSESVRKFFESFELTVAMIADLKRRFMPVVKWVAAHAPPGSKRIVNKILQKFYDLEPETITRSIHIALGLGWMGVLIKRRT